MKTLDNFIDKLKIEKSSIILLTENSLTLLMAMKEIDKLSEYSIDDLFDILIDKLIDKLGDEGTLLIQTFDWRFSRFVVFRLMYGEVTEAIYL